MRFIRFLLERSYKQLIPIIILSAIAGLSGAFAMKKLNTAIHFEIEDIRIFSLQLFTSIGVFIVASLISTKLITRHCYFILMELKRSLSEKVCNGDFKTLEAKREEINTIFTKDMDNFQMIVSRLPDVIIGFTIMISTITYIFLLSYKIGLCIIGICLCIMLIVYYMNKLLLGYSKKVLITWRRNFRLFHTMVFGMKEIYLNASLRNHLTSTIIPDALKQEQKATEKERVNIQISAKLSESLFLIGMGLIILLINLVQFEDLEVFTQVFTIILFLLAPSKSINGFFKALPVLNASLENVMNFQIGFDMRQNKEAATEELTAPFTEITFNDVRFSYIPNDPSAFSIGPLNLTLFPSEIVFIVGGNGSGKTTFFKILSGLYQPTSGDIRFGSEQIDDKNLQSYRDHFDAIFADNHLFDEMTHLDCSDNEIRELLKAYRLPDSIKVENQKISSINLSSGESKRLALIHLLLSDKKIILLDEWAAHQDFYHREKFYLETLPELKKQGKTIIVISHDERYFHIADRILRFSDGELIHENTDVLNNQTNQSH